MCVRTKNETEKSFLAFLKHPLSLPVSFSPSSSLPRSTSLHPFFLFFFIFLSLFFLPSISFSFFFHLEMAFPSSPLQKLTVYYQFCFVSPKIPAGGRNLRRHKAGPGLKLFKEIKEKCIIFFFFLFFILFLFFFIEICIKRSFLFSPLSALVRFYISRENAPEIFFSSKRETVFFYSFSYHSYFFKGHKPEAFMCINM